jgi:hypothetical protein
MTMNLIPLGRNVKYRGTVTGLRISAVDGTALIDGANASITALADGNHQIEIYDSAGRMLRGVLKAAGSGITYQDIIGGTDPTLNNGDFSSAEPPGAVWTKGTGATVAGGLGVCAGGGSAYTAAFTQEIGNLAGYYITRSWDLVSRTSGGIYMYVNGNQVETTKTVPATYSSSFTQETGTPTTLRLFNSDPVFVGTVDNVILKKWLTPGTSGATIVSAKAGTTFNFAFKDASFTLNALSYYVIVRKLR